MGLFYFYLKPNTELHGPISVVKTSAIRKVASLMAVEKESPHIFDHVLPSVR